MKIHYSVSMDEPGTHYFRVVMTLEGLQGTVPSDLVRLAMPVWTPGSYLVREYAGNVEAISVSDPGGKSLTFAKSRKNRWRVETRGAAEIRFCFRHRASWQAMLMLGTEVVARSNNMGLRATWPGMSRVPAMMAAHQPRCGWRRMPKRVENFRGILLQNTPMYLDRIRSAST